MTLPGELNPAGFGAFIIESNSIFGFTGTVTDYCIGYW
jgi:hypothetical protein